MHAVIFDLVLLMVRKSQLEAAKTLLILGWLPLSAHNSTQSVSMSFAQEAVDKIERGR